MIKWRTAVEQQNQRTLEDHTQTVESTSAAWHCAVVPPTIDSVDRMSSAVAVVAEADKLDSPAEIVDDDRVTLVAVPWASKKREMQLSLNEMGGGAVAVEISNGEGYSMRKLET